MAKNYMADVAKLLGVELDEEFKYEGLLTFGKITERGFMRRNQGERFVNVYNSDLVTFLTGFNKIEKLPWKPGYDETYYRPSEHFTNAVLTRWHDTPWDFAYQETGMLFRTAEECEAALPALKQKYLGGDGQCD